MRKGVVILCLMLACLAPAPAYQALRYPATEDPDALYAAAIRVFLRRGLGFQSSDPQARAILTKWFKVESVGLKAQTEKGFFEITDVQFRILVSNGIVEIFTDCGHANDSGVVDNDHRCEANQRPYGLADVERQLAAEIVNESHSVTTGQAVRVVGAPPPPPSLPGCTKDTDCKGDRICVHGGCAAPAGPAAPASSPSPAERSRCAITMAPEGCPWHPALVATFDDTFDGADKEQTRCMKRATEWFYFCNDTGPVVARFFKGDKVAGETTVQPTTRCEITLASEGCPGHQEVGLPAGTFNDIAEGSEHDQARCMKRAVEYHAYCASTQPVRARFYSKGALLQEQTAR